jgi:AbrB family looped-hinge helix DNA binding protein
MKYSCKVNPKGQITLPSEIRKILKIKDNDILLAQIMGEGSILLEGSSIKMSKDRVELIRVLDETFATFKKREEGS